MTAQDKDYFRERAAEERERAKTAASETAAQAHLEIAERYEAMADGVEQPRVLHIVPGASAEPAIRKSSHRG